MDRIPEPTVASETGLLGRLGVAWSGFYMLVLALLTAAPLTADAQSAGPILIVPPRAGYATTQSDPLSSERRTAVEQMLRHIYAVYFGIRSCFEISTMQKDGSFKPEVSLEEARQSLRLVDAATREIGIDSAHVWNEEAPIAVATAEALKTRPETHLEFCQKMGSLFRVDAGNLQVNLRRLGAKGPIISKDY